MGTPLADRKPPGWIERARLRWRARVTARDGAEVVLSQRRIYILPTQAGMGFAALLLVLLVGAVNYNLGLGFGLTFVAGACAVVDMIATWRNLDGLRLRAGRAGAVFAGEDAPFELHLDNPSVRDRYAIRADLDGVPVPRHALDVAAGSSTALGLALPAARRGWLGAPRVRLETRFPLGLFRAWCYWQPDSRALVYPLPEPDAPPLPMRGRPDADGGTDGVRADSADNFGGVRAYQPGDPQRHLAWRQIARLGPELGGQLVTKQFEGASSDELVLDIDALAPQLGLELRLSRLTRWVLEAERRGLPYALRLGRVEREGALGAAHQAACLRALALYGIDEELQ